ncbi:MAG: SDR family NAD(P)-dependent oxidoreductase [Verrucomicrobia bacterium]|nr:SDR family NAD(P)-dependent oxidoreductase [Verrucomicrobiota bacterium]
MFNQALITGATSGLGEALARRLAQEKIPLVLTGRNQDRLAALAQELRRIVPVATIAADLAAEREKLIYFLQTEAPDLVINNAGFCFYGEALSHPTSIQLETLEVNAIAPIELTLEAAKALKIAGKSGVILNVSSLAGELVFPTMAAYAAAKACLTSFSQSFDEEMRRSSIRILSALPGQIQTEFSQRASNQKKDHSSKAMTKEYAAEKIWRQILKRKQVERFNALYAWAAKLSRYLPRSWVLKSIRRDNPL